MPPTAGQELLTVSLWGEHSIKSEVSPTNVESTSTPVKTKKGRSVFRICLPSLVHSVGGRRQADRCPTMQALAAYLQLSHNKFA